MGLLTSKRQLIPVAGTAEDWPTAQGCVLIPANQGWTKSAWLFGQNATLRYFKLFEVPKPPPSDPVYGQGGQFRDPGRTRRKATGWYRIAHTPRGPGQKPGMSRFRLSSEHTVYSLHWLASYLNSTDVPWLYLCKGNGGKLPYSRLNSGH